jgi:hypothetical protein
MKDRVWQFIVGITLFTTGSCSSILRKSQGYKIAITELSYHDYADNFVLIPKHKLKEKAILIYNHDTTYLLNKKLRTLIFKNITDNSISIYQFHSREYYKRVDCDSNLRVVSVTESRGKIY